MRECWAVAQRKTRRCGACKGDCNFQEPRAIRTRTPKLQAALRIAASYTPSKPITFRQGTIELPEWSD